jgi:hypothetical protein
MTMSIKEKNLKEDDGKPAGTQINQLVIEWRHLSVGGATCERCGSTGSAVMEAFDELTGELGARGIKVLFREVVLDKNRLAESNMITLNGIPLEDLIAGETTETPCCSCSTLTGADACCRAVTVDNRQYEEIPAWLIKQAAYRAVGINK